MTFENLPRRIFFKIYRTLLRYPAKWYFNRQFLTAFTDDYTDFWVVDIDNTIADTWRTLTPQYRTQFKSDQERILTIPPLAGMKARFDSLTPQTRVVFLSARTYWSAWVTKKWLAQNGFSKPDSVIVLVEHPKDKVALLRRVLEKNRTPQYKISFFDDLSYNHENGDIRFYEPEIADIRQLPIHYVGYEELLQINKGEN
jgi:hypothetical protein